MGTYNLSGKTVLVTGAETGIGRAIALRALADGANIAAAGLNTDLLDETMELARDVGPGSKRVATLRDGADAIV